MATHLYRHGSSLRTVTLLVAVVALITGLLGMHVLIGTNAAHSIAAEAAPAPSTVHDSHPDAGCCGNCSGGHSVTTNCIPHLSATGLAAPEPGGTVSISTPLPAIPGSMWIMSGHHPGSPSPGELSISRT
ncbi:DUF6153 family protein [Paenarthrobacter sp. NPDC089322]|uniref:DUF6153 family protein n=1 Tax=Paenarthrobacter sp. NPDC089322 TaxID=3155065 RepID=UPI00343679F6